MLGVMPAPATPTNVGDRIADVTGAVALPTLSVVSNEPEVVTDDDFCAATAAAAAAATALDT